MKRTFLIALAAVAMVGCAAIRDLRDDENPYEKPFYEKYLNTGSTLDANINRALESVRQNPASAEAHNTLGALLVEKGFPKDAEREFERAINTDDHYFPAWYNLGLVRAARGDELGARRAFNETVDLKPGHAAALFQLGLVEEKREHRDRAIGLYAKAYTINPSLMDVRVNPRILDSKLTHLAMLRMYPAEHTRRSMQFQGSGGAMPSSRMPQAQEAPSPQAPPQRIVPPSAPATDPSQQTAPANPPAAGAGANSQPVSAAQRPSAPRRGRPTHRRVAAPDEITVDTPATATVTTTAPAPTNT
ncbi:MAG TPA: tetratricopeptide repeat protein [Thermoanaerobaculia bacterium]|jgi:tetratricopeptide (TPR) repeat protein